jgi:hypothetical protein
MTNQRKNVHAKRASNRVRHSAVATSPRRCFNPSVSAGQPPAPQPTRLGPVNDAEGDCMLTTGKAVKVTVYVSDGAKHRHVPVFTSILDFLFQSRISGATVVKGVAGFGAGHRMHAAHILEISDNLPIKIEFIETREKVDAILPELEKRIGSGLIEVQETTIIVPRPQ